MVAMPPTPKTMTTPQIAEVFGVSTRTVRVRIDHGCPLHERGGRGRPNVFRPTDVVGSKASRDASNGTTAPTGDLRNARARKEQRRRG